jgi:hypothetical protein
MPGFAPGLSFRMNGRLWPFPASGTAASWRAVARPPERQKPTHTGNSRVRGQRLLFGVPTHRRIR